MKLKRRLKAWSEKRAMAAGIEAVYGKDRINDALALAIEAGKLALRVEELEPMARSFYMLRTLDIEMLPYDSSISWGLRHGLVTEQQLAEAQKLDVLGMNSEAKS